MLPRLFRVGLAAASSALIIPYALALMAEMLYGRPKRSAEDLLMSLRPARVFTFTKSLISDMKAYKYVGLYFKWTNHYKSLTPDRVLKDIEYGHNHNTLDLYKPLKKQQSQAPHTVVIFLYGGTWSSGDKNMYSLLCSNLCHSLEALVLCPNYSIYPKGYVDDMVQDVSDVITWAREHAHAYNADKGKIVLIGHSAGAHLVALTTLELAMKHLTSLPGMVAQKLIKEEEQQVKDDFEVSYVDDSTAFLDTYFTDRSQPEGGVNLPIIREEGVAKSEGGDNEDVSIIREEGMAKSEGGDNEDVSIINGEQDMSIINTGEKDDSMIIAGEKGDEMKGESNGEEAGRSFSGSATESFFMVPREPPPKQQEALIEGADDDVQDVLRSIKLIIGLAGVYDIREQYKELERKAKEHTSHMSRAMYDQEHFDNFSPTHAINHIPPNFKLPPFWLLHGDKDTSVPLSNTLSFGKALWQRQPKGVHVSVLRGCDHYEVCLDLMDSQLKWHYSLLGELKMAFRENGL